MTSLENISPKKDALLEIAGDLFYRQGYGATGIKQISEKAGIAKGTFYSHFESKEAIGTAWLEKRNWQWNQTMKEATERASTPQAKILVLFDILEEWLKSNEYRGCAFLNSLGELPDPEADMRVVIKNHKAGIRDHLVRLSCDHFTGKTKSYAEHKGNVIFLLFEAAIVEAQNFQDGWPVKTAKKEVRSILKGSQ